MKKSYIKTLQDDAAIALEAGLLEVYNEIIERIKLYKTYKHNYYISRKEIKV